MADRTYMRVGSVRTFSRIVPDSEFSAYCSRAASASNRRCKTGKASGPQLLDRLKVFLYSCAYCGRSLRVIELVVHRVNKFYCESFDLEPLQFDHRVPVARGGTGWPANLVPSCVSCNSKKGTL